jgi:hypothetical protein
MNAKQRRALDLLAGSPEGLTGDVLKASGHSPQTLRALVSFGFTSATVERISEDGMVRTRYRITPAGRKVRSMGEP